MRKTKGLKVYELANKLGVCPEYITQIELSSLSNNKKRKPSLHMLNSLIDMFKSKWLIKKYFKQFYKQHFETYMRIYSLRS